MGRSPSTCMACTYHRHHYCDLTVDGRDREADFSYGDVGMRSQVEPEVVLVRLKLNRHTCEIGFPLEARSELDYCECMRDG